MRPDTLTGTQQLLVTQPPFLRGRVVLWKSVSAYRHISSYVMWWGELMRHEKPG